MKRQAIIDFHIYTSPISDSASSDGPAGGEPAHIKRIGIRKLARYGRTMQNGTHGSKIQNNELWQIDMIHIVKGSCLTVISRKWPNV